MSVVRHDAVVTKMLKVESRNDATKPSISFGDGDTGIYESSANNLAFALGGSFLYKFTGTQMGPATISYGKILNEAPTNTNPVLIPNDQDTDTGLGWAEADALCLIAGTSEGLRLTEVASHVIQAHESEVGLTADSGSSQGDGPIRSTYNVYDTVAGAGDAATLPSVFVVGTIIVVKNGAAANSMDVFPASGDDLGAGANTQVAIAAGDFKVFLATTANSTWEQIMGGTA